MFERIPTWARSNHKTIALTLKIFRTLAFLFDRVASVKSVDIPQFM